MCPSNLSLSLSLTRYVASRMYAQCVFWPTRYVCFAASLLFGTSVVDTAALLCFFAGMANRSKHDIPGASEDPCYCNASLGIPATAMQVLLHCIPATAMQMHPCYCTASLLLHCIAHVMTAVLQMLLF